MLRAKVSEIFSSIQGEGKYAGEKQTFVRFYGCNIHCTWCDTPNSIGDIKGDFTEYDCEQLLERVLSLGKDIQAVSLTGGEPLVQKDFIKIFLPKLKKEGIKAYLETSGILHKELQEIIDDIDIVAMDIKLPSSTQCPPFWKEHEEFLKVSLARDCFIKIVISSATLKEDIVKAVDIVSKINRDIVFVLQPNFFDLQNGVTKKCLEFQEYSRQYLRQVRIIPQMHKFLKLR